MCNTIDNLYKQPTFNTIINDMDDFMRVKNEKYPEHRHVEDIEEVFIKLLKRWKEKWLSQRLPQLWNQLLKRYN